MIPAGPRLTRAESLMAEPNAMKDDQRGGLGNALRLLFGGRNNDRRAARGAVVLRVQPHDLVPGEAVRGHALLAGDYGFVGEILSAREAAPWADQSLGAAWFDALHGFSWLRDLRVIGTSAARTRACALVQDWIERSEDLPGSARAPAVTGARLAAWLVNHDFLLGAPTDSFAQLFHASLLSQAKQLARTARRGDHGADRFAALKGLIYCSVALPDGDHRLQQVLKALETELIEQVLPDGVHVSRSPSTQLAVLRDLIDLRATLIAAHQAPPVALQNSIDRLALMVRGFRHGDGRLALFNDSLEEEVWLVDRVLGLADAKGRPLSDARHGGFQRVQAGRTLVLMDAGVPPMHGLHGHAGTLSLEISVGKERLITNCGAWRGPDAQWAQALRASAAHSTLTVDDTNSAAVLDEGGIGVGPNRIDFNREEKEGAVWLDASHDGYVQPFGLMHTRRLYVAADGGDLRGEDRLTSLGGARRAGRSFAVRFHLHPDVRASLVQDGASVLLRLPSGVGWHLRAGGGSLDLAESVYAGKAGERRRTEQVFITGGIEPDETIIKWALRRIPKG